MTVSGNMNVQIEGGSPWGFRLQGGGGFPLQVIKIRKRSKSFKHLVEGDIIIKVNGVSAQGKSHEAVMDMVDATVGPVLHLEIHRGEALHKIPKTAPAPAPRTAVAPASQASSRSSSVQSSEQSMHQHSMEESMHHKMISSQQMSSQQSSQQSVHHQQQQVAKSNLVLQNQQQQQQQRVTQRQLSGQWQESSSQHQQQMSQQQMSYQEQQYALQRQQAMADQQRLAQQQMSSQEQQYSLQHQQAMADQQRLAQQQYAEQQMIRQQLAQQRQMVEQQQAMSEQQRMQSMSSVQQTHEESHHEEQTTRVSQAMWNSSQSINELHSEMVQQAVTSSPKPFKPKIAGHLPLRDFTPVKPSPPATPARMTPVPPPAYDKENVAPSPVPKAPTPVNVPQFNVKNIKNIVNQEWREAELEELDLPVPDYTKKMTIPPRPVEHEPTPPMPKKEIAIPDMTLKPAPAVAPKPKRVFAEVQLPVDAEPWIPDDEIIPIKPEDRPHLPIFGPPVVYGLNPALAPNAGEDESMISETSSGSRKKKIYSDSSFYYDPKGVYPTIEDQMDLCKKISNSLTAAANSRARGATMFAKRQKRSNKWIHAGFSEGMVADLEELASELDEFDGGNKPLFQFRIPKVAAQVSVDSSSTMSMSREEFENYRTTQPKVDHKMANPNAVGLMADLQNSKGRGAKLFAKRQARCEKFVVDEKAISQSAPTTPSEPPPVTISQTEMMNIQNRLANMIQQPMPIIQAQAQQSQAPPPTAPKPQYAPPQFAPQQPMFAPAPPPAVNKHIGVALPTTNADLKAEFKNAIDGPNFNRVARGWKIGPSEIPCSSDL